MVINVIIGKTKAHWTITLEKYLLSICIKLLILNEDGNDEEGEVQLSRFETFLT